LGERILGLLGGAIYLEGKGIMAKQISDIIRDKIVKARKGRSDASESKGIFLTDNEACNLWVRLTSVEAEISMLEDNIIGETKESSKRVKNALSAAKKEFKKLEERGKRRDGEIS